MLDAGKITLDGVDVALMSRTSCARDGHGAAGCLTWPSVLILDEATSSVDTRAEVLAQTAMSALRSERTSSVIANRLSTIRDVDLILAMASGQIVERGRRVSFLGARGVFGAACGRGGGGLGKYSGGALEGETAVRSVRAP